MSLTLVPMIAGPAQLGNLETDWVPSISDMDAAVADLQTKVQEFAAESFNAVDVSPDEGWLMAWNKFVNELNDFKGAIWFNRWQRRSDIIAFRQRFNDLVAWWHRQPGAPPPSSSSTPTYKPDQITPPTSSLDATIKWAAIGLVAIAAISALAQLSPAIKQLLPTKGGSR